MDQGPWRGSCLRDKKYVINADENQIAAKAIMLLLLTGARRTEITRAKWEYVDWEKRTLQYRKSRLGVRS